MTLNEYQTLAGETAIYPDRESILGLIYTTLKLNGEAGEIAEKVGKIMRDEPHTLTEDLAENIAKELGDVLWYVANVAYELGFSLDRVAAMNLSKLADRKARDVLGGSGDNR